jgi:7-hydroxymethyl chlorophyll a reductase
MHALPCGVALSCLPAGGRAEWRSVAPSSSASTAGLAARRRSTRCSALPSDWRKARPIAPGSAYPAKEHCSECGLCDTYFVAHVKDACAFLGEGMGRIPAAEERVHGRSRRLDGDELWFGVNERMAHVRAAPPLPGSQWTGVVTTVALAMLRSGAVEGVVCCASQPDNPLKPRPILALTEADVLSSRGVKPMLSPTLSVLAEVEARGLKRLLFIGVGCAVQALRAVEPHLGLDALYVMGTNCTDNGRESGLNKFLTAVSAEPETVTGYEFMADYRVHVKHKDGALYEKVPYFCLPAGELSDGVIAPSCRACFDYTNALADLVVGYMAVPDEGVPMTQHNQYVTVRNARGAAMLAAAGDALSFAPTASSGDRRAFVLETVLADDAAVLGKQQPPAPRWLGEALATALGAVGPRGLEFARYSIEYHTIRNVLHTTRAFTPKQAAAHVPPYAVKMVDAYDKGGAIRARAALRPGQPLPQSAVGPSPAVLAAAAALLAAAAWWLTLHGGLGMQ